MGIGLEKLGLRTRGQKDTRDRDGNSPLSGIFIQQPCSTKNAGEICLVTASGLD